MGTFGEGRAKDAVDVRKVLDSGAWEQLTLWVQDGALLSIGCTRDGGALGITVTIDGEWEREYFRDAEQLELWVDGLAVAAKEALLSSSASRAPAKRKKGLRTV